MNPISLTFQDQQLETRFQKSTEKNILYQFEKMIISFVFVGIIVICIELANFDYLAVGIYCLYLLVYVGFYFYIRSNQNLAIKYLKLFNLMTFIIPIVDVLLSIFDILSLKTQVAFILMVQLYIPLLNSSYNIVLDLVFICISMGINVYHISYLIGFSPYYLVLCCGLFHLSFQRYFQVKVERSLFSQSIVNQSLVDVITKICKENIIIFTYNLEQLKYEKVIINETAKSYYNTDILGDILKDIQLKNSSTDISSFIFRNCIQKQKRGEIELKGYYRSKSNKIQINLYVTQYENIQIILKIEKKQDKTTNIRKANKLVNLQLCFLQNLHKRFHDYSLQCSKIDFSKIINFHHYLHKSIIYNKLQIFSIAKWSSIQIQCINLEYLIQNVFNTWNMKNQIKFIGGSPSICEKQEKEKEIIVESQQMLLELMLNVVVLFLRKLAMESKDKILIDLTQFEYIVSLTFLYNPKKKENSCHQTLKYSLQKLITLLGISGSLIMKQNRLSFKILKKLEQRF